MKDVGTHSVEEFAGVADNEECLWPPERTRGCACVCKTGMCVCAMLL